MRKFLFTLDPERAHTIALNSLQCAYRLNLLRLLPPPVDAPITLMGLNFKNKIGLAAGFDLNGEYVDALAALGFGFIEIGGVTPKPQAGNPKPRIFRLIRDKALINRKGFANNGVDAMISNLEKMRYRGVLGINIAKSFNTPADHAVDDYVFCFQQLSSFASYFSINISSPNTPGHRTLQQPEILHPLLSELKNQQQAHLQSKSKYIPLVVKLSPDMTETELHKTVEILLENNIDGVIATNTTLDHTLLSDSPLAGEVGGLSGKPLQARCTHVIKQLHQLLKNKIPIIGLGGTMDEASAREKMSAGASLLQIYTGLIYEGPGLIRRLANLERTSGSR